MDVQQDNQIHDDGCRLGVDNNSSKSGTSKNTVGTNGVHKPTVSRSETKGEGWWGEGNTEYRIATASRPLGDRVARGKRGASGTYSETGSVQEVRRAYHGGKRMSEFFVPEHEMYLLAHLMKSEDKVYDVMGTLLPTTFNGEMHEKLCEIIYDLARDGIAPNAQLVRASIDTKDAWGSVGGEGHFEKIVAIKIDFAGFDLYYESVMDAFKRRQLSIIAQNISVGIHNHANISDFIGDIQSSLSGLGEGTLRAGVKPIKELLISAWDILKERRETKGVLVGVTTGFDSIDEVTGGYLEGDVWIYSGRPSQGKTTVLIQSFKDSAKAGVPCLLFNREMSSMQMMFRFLAMEDGSSHSDIKTGQLSDNKFKGLKTIRNRLSKLPIYLDSNYYGDINYITSSIRKYHKLHDIRLVGIDYVQLLAERGGDQVAELGRISRELKLLAMDLGITVVILSQLNRKVEDREDRRPILSDLRQSGNLEEDADVVIGLYRDEYYNMNSTAPGKVEFIILKQRNGPTGRYTLSFNSKSLQIMDSPEFKFGRDSDGKE